MLMTCLSIFSARVVDVSLGTLRMVFTVKGKSLIAALFAFVEVFIWFLVAREALNTTIDSLLVPIAYALGYAAGTLIGTFISNRFVNGLIGVQIITKKDNFELLEAIRDNGFGISIVALKNSVDDVEKEMLFIETSKKSLNQLKSLVKNIDATAFMIVNETKLVQNGLIK